MESTILTRIDPDDPEFEKAKELATPGRILLDIKRSGIYKARAVKQGFKEDKAKADGADFNYHAHVAKLASVRTSLFRPNRRGRRVALKDVQTAFLQSHAYEDGMVKYVCFRHPVTGEWHYYRQTGPIYGEASAPVRWENTVAPWLEEQGFIRGDNEKCVFYHPERDLLLLLYVDDCLVDGEEEDIKWIFDLLDERFACKDGEWLDQDTPLDYLGMEMSLDADHIYLSMSNYIQNTIKLLGFDKLKVASTPIDKEMNLTVRLFRTSIGASL